MFLNASWKRNQLRLEFVIVWSSEEFHAEFHEHQDLRVAQLLSCISYRSRPLKVNVKIKMSFWNLPYFIFCYFIEIFLSRSDSKFFIRQNIFPFKPMIFGLKTDVITLWVQLYWLQVNSVSMTWKATVGDDNTLITWPSWQCSKGHMLIFYW